MKLDRGKHKTALSIFLGSKRQKVRKKDPNLENIGGTESRRKVKGLTLFTRKDIRRSLQRSVSRTKFVGEFVAHIFHQVAGESGSP
jgi:hypothetical protein